MRSSWFLAATIMFIAWRGSVLAANQGNEVVVLYNAHLPESKALADYYAARREIPRSQVWGFDTSTNEEISRAEFRDTIQKPLLAKLESAKLWEFGMAVLRPRNRKPLQAMIPVKAEVRYAVLCYGMPLKIKNDPTVSGPQEEAVRAEFRINMAAVDSELACLPLIKTEAPLSGPLFNGAFSTTNSAELNPTNGVFMVTRLDGPTPEIARGLVDKALQAEAEGMWGRAYIDLRNITDPGFKPGDDWIRGAGEVCRLVGFETVVDTNEATFPVGFPMSQIGFYCGWYDVAVSGPFVLPEVEFMPGAFAYHLYSYSAGTLRDANAFWVAPLLAKGATITMGCVYEPYLGGTPNVGIFAARFLLQHFNFGEAAYACQNELSWQTTVVGDPLYAPYQKPLAALHDQFLKTQSPLTAWSHLRAMDVAETKGIPANKLIAYLDEQTMTRTNAILSEKMGDLCVAAGKPTTAIDSYKQALKYNPTREQALRIRFSLGEQLTTAGRAAEAYENYLALMKNWPDYPGRLNVYKLLLPLAQKLDRPKDAILWDQQIRALTPPAK